MKGRIRYRKRIQEEHEAEETMQEFRYYLTSQEFND